MTSPEKIEMSTHIPDCLMLPIKIGVDKQGRKYIGEVLKSLLLDPLIPWSVLREKLLS